MAPILFNGEAKPYGPERYWQTEHVDWGVIRREFYRRDGNWEQRWSRDASGAEWSIVRQFDSAGGWFRNNAAGWTLKHSPTITMSTSGLRASMQSCVGEAPRK